MPNSSGGQQEVEQEEEVEEVEEVGEGAREQDLGQQDEERVVIGACERVRQARVSLVLPRGQHPPERMWREGRHSEACVRAEHDANHANKTPQEVRVCSEVRGHVRTYCAWAGSSPRRRRGR